MVTAFLLLIALSSELIATGSKGRNMPGPLGILARVMRNRHIIRLALTAAVALGITAGVRIHFFFVLVLSLTVAAGAINIE